MMKSSSNNKDRFLQFLANNSASLFFFFFLTCLTIITIFSLHLISPNTNIEYSKIAMQELNQTKTSTPPKKEIESSDLFKGRWIHDPNATLYYTNYSCTTIPSTKNCFLHGREDTDFLNWKWKPDQCELPRFSALSFLSILRGKKMAFIGDSLARNQMESLLCLLSTVETPKSIEKDAEDRFRTWEFPKHNFTLTVLWSKFLVAAAEIVVNGTGTGTATYDIHLDRADAKWSERLPSVDYVVFSSAHWYFRPSYLYEDGHVIGCTFCNETNITDIGPGRAIGMGFRAALRAVNNCPNCKKVVSFVRTFSPPHFENGEWNTGGTCNRTGPVEREEVVSWEYRKVQVEELERARDEGKGNNEFEILDVTEMMAMRVDGHPGLHWEHDWMKDASDCVHWCLPGPIDTWNELLLEKIKRLDGISS